MGILFCKNNVTEMCTIYTYQLLEFGIQIRKNSLVHRSWDSGQKNLNKKLQKEDDESTSNEK